MATLILWSPIKKRTFSTAHKQNLIHFFDKIEMPSAFQPLHILNFSDGLNFQRKIDFSQFSFTNEMATQF